MTRGVAPAAALDSGALPALEELALRHPASVAAKAAVYKARANLWGCRVRAVNRVRAAGRTGLKSCSA